MPTSISLDNLKNILHINHTIKGQVTYKIVNLFILRFCYMDHVTYYVLCHLKSQKVQARSECNLSFCSAKNDVYQMCSRQLNSALLSKKEFNNKYNKICKRETP